MISFHGMAPSVEGSFYCSAGKWNNKCSKIYSLNWTCGAEVLWNWALCRVVKWERRKKECYSSGMRMLSYTKRKKESEYYSVYSFQIKTFKILTWPSLVRSSSLHFVKMLCKYCTGSPCLVRFQLVWSPV